MLTVRNVALPYMLGLAESIIPGAKSILMLKTDFFELEWDLLLHKFEWAV